LTEEPLRVLNSDSRKIPAEDFPATKKICATMPDCSGFEENLIHNGKNAKTTDGFRSTLKSSISGQVTSSFRQAPSNPPPGAAVSIS
jgi:hypothetical protein